MQPAIPVTLVRGEASRRKALSTPDPAADRRVDALNGLTLLHRKVAAASLRLIDQRGGMPLCVEGCGHCCEQNVPVATMLEAHHAVATMQVPQEALDAGWEWLTRPDPQLTVYPDEKPAVLGGLPGTATGNRDRLVIEIREAVSGACPFLSAEKRCLVHDGRPLACRAGNFTWEVGQGCAAPEPDVLGPRIDYQAGHDLRAETDHLRVLDPSVAVSGLWPSMVLRVADPDRFERLARAGAIPLAKMVFAPPGPYPGALTAEDAEAIAVLRSMHRARRTSDSV